MTMKVPRCKGFCCSCIEAEPSDWYSQPLLLFMYNEPPPPNPGLHLKQFVTEETKAPTTPAVLRSKHFANTIHTLLYFCSRLFSIQLKQTQSGCVAPCDPFALCLQSLLSHARRSMAPYVQDERRTQCVHASARRSAAPHCYSTS